MSFAVLGALLVAVVVPVARTVLVRLPKFADIAPLALPIAIQPAIYLVQLPFAAALRGMHRARLLFFQYLAFTGTSLTGLVVGARLDRLPGAAWGLTIGSAVGLVVMVGFWWYALQDAYVRNLTGKGDLKVTAGFGIGSSAVWPDKDELASLPAAGSCVFWLCSMYAYTSGCADDSSYSASSRIMAANSFGSRIATVPRYFDSNASARSSARAIACSMRGSSGEVKSSLRSQRTVSAPVDLVA